MQQAREEKDCWLRACTLDRTVDAAELTHPMRPATRLHWLRGLSQSVAPVSLAVTLTHTPGDQFFTPRTEIDRILVLLSLRLPATGLNLCAGRLHPEQMYVSLHQRRSVLAARMAMLQINLGQRGQTL